MKQEQPYVRPPFISEGRWESFGAADKHFWHQIGVDGAEAMKQPFFRRLLMLFVDHPEWSGSSALTFDAQNARAQDYAEGRRSIGIQMRLLFQHIAPDLYVRALTEQMNMNRALDQTKRAEEAARAAEEEQT